MSVVGTGRGTLLIHHFNSNSRIEQLDYTVNQLCNAMKNVYEPIESIENLAEYISGVDEIGRAHV